MVGELGPKLSGLMYDFGQHRFRVRQQVFYLYNSTFYTLIFIGNDSFHVGIGTLSI